MVTVVGEGHSGIETLSLDRGRETEWEGDGVSGREMESVGVRQNEGRETGT